MPSCSLGERTPVNKAPRCPGLKKYPPARPRPHQRSAERESHDSMPVLTRDEVAVAVPLTRRGHPQIAIEAQDYETTASIDDDTHDSGIVAEITWCA